MNYHKYFSVDVVNGPGTRCTLFVSGCEHRCEGCYNKATWHPNSGDKFTEALQTQIIKDLKDTRIKRRGLSLSGGDPLYPSNLKTILHLVKTVKQECPDKDIWLWTGYTLENFSEQQRQILPFIDVLIDGKFEIEHANPTLTWRGSANQMIYQIDKHGNSQKLRLDH
ncbi:anaerobic ribonucleoside-triphosphate reductase-activating protein [Zooshikella ganghwensis]|uniref:Anaerobic ribonucleoside-triphosphate reductase-activating protein n=1 Tax=Zooshikella ganghwensis TaxID=202772 RepID=A0A4P9VJT7_9GAMM|nr:anaerobic ribonucleoside-triphosphate reductase-activating protein [Zooshikella ganghwensis]RDH42062.1 anaerobic ribonucleoside-triphosphate reductase-activating protein [Zooshikella ganghwensis]